MIEKTTHILDRCVKCNKLRIVFNNSGLCITCTKNKNVEKNEL